MEVCLPNEETIHEVSFWPGSPLSYTTTKITVLRDATALSVATGFVFLFAQRYFLVTNYHVLAGVHPATGRVLSSTGATPNRIECHVALSTQSTDPEKPGELLFFKPMSIAIVDEAELPLWLDDHVGGRQNDYAIIALNPLLPELSEKGTTLRAIHGGRVTLKRGVQEPNAPSARVSKDSTQHFYPPVGTTVFVLGYPQGVISSGIFPIWKGATIASEPLAGVTLTDGDYGNLFYIDSTTKSGMSIAGSCLGKSRGPLSY